MTEKLYDYNPADALDTPEAIAIFMTDAFESANTNYITKALSLVAKTKGMNQIAKESGLSHEELSHSLSEGGNPTLKTMFAILGSLDLDITAKPHIQPVH